MHTYLHIFLKIQPLLFMFWQNGINLAIVGPSGPQPNNEAEIRASIEQVLLQRVQMSDPASDLLDLSALAKNRIIAQMLQHMDTNCILRMILDTLCELSAEYLQHIRVLRLRGNRLHDLLAFRYWPESVELRVLDLSDNEVEGMWMRRKGIVLFVLLRIYYTFTV